MNLFIFLVFLAFTYSHQVGKPKNSQVHQPGIQDYERCRELCTQWQGKHCADCLNRIQEDGQDQLVEQDDKQGDGQGVQRDRPGSQICQQCQELCAHGIETSCKDCLKQWTIMVLGKEGKQQDVGQGAQEDQPFVQICQRCTGICANELGQDCPDCINDLYQWMAINGKGGLIFESYWQGSCLFDCIEDYQYQDCQNCLRRIREIGDHLI